MGRFGFLLHLLFVGIAAGPPGAHKAVLHLFLELGIGGNLVRVVVAQFGGAGKHLGLNRLEQILHSLDDACLVDRLFALFAGDVTAGEDGNILGHIARADFHAQGDAAQFPVVELEAGGQIVTVIDLDTHASLDQFRLHLLHGGHDHTLFLILLVDRHNDQLIGG